MKNPSIPLRLASALSLVFAVGHTLGGLKSWSPVGPTEVLNAMRTFRFDVSGVHRSYLDFYLGFGFLLSVYLVTQAVLLWQLGSLARADRSHARPLAWIFFVSSIPIGFLTWMFLFPTPVYFDAGLTAILGWAVFALTRFRPADAASGGSRAR
jgi:hypothetical protein